MEYILKQYNTSEVLKLIRKDLNLTQRDFVKKINKTHDWLAKKENNKNNIYINDFLYIIKVYSISIYFINANGRNIKLNDYNSIDLFKILRELTGKTQGEFASIIGKKNDWAYTIEAGINNYYANDLFELARLNNFEIKMII